MDVFKLSRDWFDFSFENPEKIKPNHSALYFFCIEHCNRLGWKNKFGLPTTMAKEAIGISSYNTFKNTLNDLVEWGFVKMIKKSQNQFSSNIIALSNFDKSLDKSLDKALIKHGSKHVTNQSEITGSIDIQETSIQETNNTPKAWQEDFEVYLSDLRLAYDSFLKDEKVIKEQQEFYPSVNIPLSIKKVTLDYWSKKEGWEKKIKSKSKEIDWVKTFKNSLKYPENRVYHERGKLNGNQAKKSDAELSSEEFIQKYGFMKNTDYLASAKSS